MPDARTPEEKQKENERLKRERDARRKARAAVEPKPEPEVPPHQLAAAKEEYAAGHDERLQEIIATRLNAARVFEDGLRAAIARMQKRQRDPRGRILIVPADALPPGGNGRY